ncbi:MAG: glycoside hydrolase family 57 protein [Candidatus Woesebacteria bacterium]
MSRSICLYLHAHQPYRVAGYSVFDAGKNSNYFAMVKDGHDINYDVLQKVAHKSYLKTNECLLKLLKDHPEFKLALSITGTLLDQLEAWSPQTLDSFKRLVATGRVEILAETYYHSLAFFYSMFEFEKQVHMHHQKIQDIFGIVPVVFRNTELAYNNDVAAWADQAGYKGIVAEGWDRILNQQSPNHVYRPINTKNIRLLLKNYKLSDDIAFRFSDRSWAEWPLTVKKFTHWLNALPSDQQLVNLFMDYETFGEHQWKEHGIFDFLTALPAEFGKFNGNMFVTPSEAIDKFEPKGQIDAPQTITWADAERDLTAWLGNTMQQQAINSLYNLEEIVLTSGDNTIINDWRKLQTSDHFYYMCTKWFTDGDVHAYFSPYDSPYDGFVNYMNVLRDLKLRILDAHKERSK